jgi:hypothetical protein
MNQVRPGVLRVSSSRFELTVSTDDDRVVDVGLDIDGGTAHVLRHLLAAYVDPATGHRRRCVGRALLDRALGAVGAVSERIEVHHGQPPRFALALVAPTGCIERIDLDLVDTAELVVTRQLPVVAVGWPQRDWDGALGELLA